MQPSQLRAAGAGSLVGTAIALAFAALQSLVVVDERQATAEPQDQAHEQDAAPGSVSTSGAERRPSRSE